MQVQMGPVRRWHVLFLKSYSDSSIFRSVRARESFSVEGSSPAIRLTMPKFMETARTPSFTDLDHVFIDEVRLVTKFLGLLVNCARWKNLILSSGPANNGLQFEPCPLELLSYSFSSRFSTFSNSASSSSMSA